MTPADSRNTTHRTLCVAIKHTNYQGYTVPVSVCKSVHNYTNDFCIQVHICTLYVCKDAACVLCGWHISLPTRPFMVIQTHTCHTGTHPGTQPVSSPRKLCPNKQARQHPLVSPPAPSAPSYSSSPTFSVSACRDLVFLFLSVRSCFYCAIFCHFGPRKGGRNAISPPLRPLLWGRVAWPVCWAEEKGERRGQGEL